MRSLKDFYTHWKWGLGSCGAWQYLDSCGWCVRSTWHAWLACSFAINVISHIGAFITATFHYRLLHSLFMCFPFISLSNVYAVYSFFACASKQAGLPEEASNLSNLLISQSSELENWAQFFLFPRISAAKRRQKKMVKCLKKPFFLTCDTGLEEKMELRT